MDTKPVYVFAKWFIKEGYLETVLKLLVEVAAKSREEEGNLMYKIYQSNTELNTIILYEAYQDEAALSKHRNADYFQNIVLHNIVPLLEKREVLLANELEVIL